MGSCCSVLAPRDVLAMLAAKLPTQPSKGAERDKLYKRACELNREECGARSCTATALVQALQELYQVHKISAEVSRVCEHLAYPSALRYGMGRLNFKERRQQSSANECDAVSAGQVRGEVLRYEIRFLLCYIIAFFRTKAILEETAGLRLVEDPQVTTIDSFSFRTVKAKFESEFRIAIPAGGMALMHRETAAAASLAMPATDETPIPLGALVEHLVATQFYDDLTPEDEPPRAVERAPPNVASQNSNNVAGSGSPGATKALSPAPPKALAPATTRGRQFGALLNELKDDEPTPTPVETPQAVQTPQKAESVASSMRGESSMRPLSRAGSHVSRSTSRERISAQLPPPPTPGSFGSTNTTSSLSMWRSARALIPLGLTEEDAWAREDLFERFLSKKKATHLNEMDLFQGVQQYFMLKEIFPNGGLVVSQAVSSAYVASLHRLPTPSLLGSTSKSSSLKGSTKTPIMESKDNERSPSTLTNDDGKTAMTAADAEDGEEACIRNVSRFHVFLAVLVALLDLHFALKRMIVKAEGDRHTASQAAKSEVLAAHTHQRGPQAQSSSAQPGRAPNPLTPPVGEQVVAALQAGCDIATTAVPLYEQNRIYQQTVGPVPLELFLEILTRKLVAGDPSGEAPKEEAVGSGANEEASSLAPSSSAAAAFDHISNVLMLPPVVLEHPRVAGMVEALIVAIRHSSTSTVAGPGGVPRVSLEKLGSRLGIFICDALYLPRVSADTKKAFFCLEPEKEGERRALLQLLNTKARQRQSNAFEADTSDNGSTTPSDPNQLRVNFSVMAAFANELQLYDVSESVESMLQCALAQAKEFERAAYLSRFTSSFPRNAIAAQESSPLPSGEIIDEEALLAQPLPWYRVLHRLYATLCVAAAVESVRQPPLLDLAELSPIDMNAPVSVKEWGHLSRGVFDGLGLRKHLNGADPFAAYHGLRRSNDEDVVTTAAICRWVSERRLRQLQHEAKPTRFQWYHVLTQRLPAATAEVDEPRCQSLFVRLTDGRDDAAVPSSHLASLLGAAYDLNMLFDAADVGCEDMWEAICTDAADASDAIAARRPSLIEEETFRPCLCYLQGSIACYFTGERMLLPPIDGHADRQPTNLSTLPIKKDQFAELVQRLQLTDAFSGGKDAISDEFASLSNGTTSTRLQYVAHLVGIMDQRKLPVRKADVWRRVGPLLRQLADNEDQLTKFFAFGIQKDHAIHCTALELQRAIGKDWCLDLLLGNASAVGPLLRDAIGVANSTRYPIPKDTSLLTKDCVAALLTFLYTYLDVAVATEDHMRVVRSRRRSSAAAQSSLRVTEGMFLALDAVFTRNGIQFGGVGGGSAAPKGGHATSGSTTPNESLASTPKHPRSTAVASIASPVPSIASTPSSPNLVVAADGPNKGALEKVFEVLKSADGHCSADAIAHWAAHAAVRSRFGLGHLTPKKQPSSHQQRSGQSESNARRQYVSGHPGSPWTQLRAKLPIDTDARQSQRRSILFQQFDVTQRRTHLTPAELVDGAQWILGMDVFRVELPAVVHRAAAAAKDSLRAYFDGGSDGGMSKVSPQYGRSIKDALDSRDVTPLEFRLVLVYLYQYLELYYMFDQLMGVSASMDGLLAQSSNKEREGGTTANDKAMEGTGLSVDIKRKLPKHITYQAFVKGGDMLVQWGLDVHEFADADVLFRRINGGRDGVLLFTDFAIWASREQLHIEEPDFSTTTS